MVTTGNQARATKSPQNTPTSHVLAIDCKSLNVPNLITLLRLVLAFVLFVMIYVEALWISAAVVFVAAACTDALDGCIARRYGMVTVLGRVLDPFVDKIIICGSFIFLLNKNIDFGSGMALTSGVNEWMVIIIIGREMFVNSLRAFLEQHGRDFSATLSGKIKMVTQCIAVTVGLLSLSPDIGGQYPKFNVLRDVLLWTAVAVTAYSGVTYSYRAFVMLRAESQA